MADIKIFTFNRNEFYQWGTALEFTDKKIWKKASATGLAFSFCCLVVCILQFYSEPAASTFRKIIRIAINFSSFSIFLYLVFNPLNYFAYGILFYIYGSGNLLDNGNILGAFCIALSFLFLNTHGFFKKYRTLKICALNAVPVFCLSIQFMNTGIVRFLISIMHIFGAGLIFFLAWLLVLPKIQKASSMKSEKILSRREFSAGDMESLQLVLNGEKYGKLAQLNGISESTVKAHMIELYHKLGVGNRTEFLTVYNGCTFILKD